MLFFIAKYLIGQKSEFLKSNENKIQRTFFRAKNVFRTKVRSLFLGDEEYVRRKNSLKKKKFDTVFMFFRMKVRNSILFCSLFVILLYFTSRDLRLLSDLLARFKPASLHTVRCWQRISRIKTVNHAFHT